MKVTANFKDAEVPEEFGNLHGDLELQTLLEDIAADDLVNESDLRAFKKDLGLKTMKRLHKCRHADRKRRAALATDRRKKALARKTAKACAGPKAKKLMKCKR